MSLATKVGLSLAVGGPLMFSLISGKILFSDRDLVLRMTAFEAANWLLVAAMFGVVRWEGAKLDSIGLRRPTPTTLLVGVAVFVLLIVLFPVVESILPVLGIGSAQPTASRLLELPPWLLFLGTIRAGVQEELLFRGYLIERLGPVIGHRWLAAGITLAAFSLLHLGSWPPGFLIYVTLFGGILTVLYLIRRDLVCNMLAHALADTVGFLLISSAL
jgi:membrane protease YdiL (CAAX protease family)